MDSIIPNLALMKFPSYYIPKGHEVGFYIDDPDKVFISVIFPKNRSQALGIKKTKELQYNCPVIIGGTGYRYNVKLPREIEFSKPDYSLYKVCNKCGHTWIEKKPRSCHCKDNKRVPMFYSMGFTSRGCVRNCSFCIVRKKEGPLTEWDDLHNFHTNGFDTIMLLDNNLLACDFPVCGACIGSPKQYYWEYILDYFINNKLKLWEHGLDIRYVTDEKAQILSRVKPFRQWHFAFDSYQVEKSFRKGMEILLNNGIKASKIMVYVLAFYNTGINDALNRINIIEEYGADPYLMPYQIRNEDEKHFARWVNNKFVHGARSWKQYQEDVRKGNWRKEA